MILRCSRKNVVKVVVVGSFRRKATSGVPGVQEAGEEAASIA
jgi:hypothetical protein